VKVKSGAWMLFHRERVINSTSLEQTVQQLKPSTTYEFRVVAWNSHGPSQQAARTELVTLPEGMAVDISIFSVDTFWSDDPRPLTGGFNPAMTLFRKFLVLMIFITKLTAESIEVRISLK